jgi:hypothetical protein
VGRRRGQQHLLIQTGGGCRSRLSAGGGDGPVRGGSLRGDLGTPIPLTQRVSGERGCAQVNCGGWGKRGWLGQDLTGASDLSLVISRTGGIRVPKAAVMGTGLGRGREEGDRVSLRRGGVGRGLKRRARTVQNGCSWALMDDGDGGPVSASMQGRGARVHVSARKLFVCTARRQPWRPRRCREGHHVPARRPCGQGGDSSNRRHREAMQAVHRRAHANG